MRSLGRLSSKWTAFFGVLAALSCMIQPAVMVKENDFKKCHQSGFCKRNREYADNAVSQASTWAAPYNILSDSASFKDGQLQAVILKTINDAQETVRLPLTVSFLASGTARVSVDEEKRQKGDIVLRNDSPVRKERYNEAEKHTIVGGLNLDKDAKVTYQDKDQITIQYGPSSKFEAVIKFSPFSVDFKRDGSSHIKLNDPACSTWSIGVPRSTSPSRKRRRARRPPTRRTPPSPLT